MDIREQIQDLIKGFFRGLEFAEETHDYFYKHQKLTSVSALIKNFYEPFDAHKVSNIIAPYKGETPEALREQWTAINKESIVKGHRTHSFAEFRTTRQAQTPQEFAVLDFWANVPDRYISIGQEIRMVHQLNLFTGTMDELLYDTWTQTLVVADYKTNKDLFKNYKGKRMLAPFNGMLDCPFTHYELQLSFYQILIEQIGIPVSDRWVIWLPHSGGWLRYQTPSYSNHLKHWMGNKTFIKS